MFALQDLKRRRIEEPFSTEKLICQIASSERDNKQLLNAVSALIKDLRWGSLSLSNAYKVLVLSCLLSTNGQRVPQIGIYFLAEQIFFCTEKLTINHNIQTLQYQSVLHFFYACVVHISTFMYTLSFLVLFVYMCFLIIIFLNM